MKYSNVLVSLSVLIVLFTTCGTISSVHAATLAGAKDTISNSRPSPSSNLTANYLSTDTQVTIGNNGSRFLASDSARLINASGVVLGSPLIVASQSADLTKVFLSNSGGTAAGSGSDILISPVTAKHTITFSTITGIASTGKIVITFPGTGVNTASPSASTFSFNGLASGNISVSGATCGSYTISAPTITCNLSALVSGGTAVTFTIGSTTPALINPTNASGTAGVSDSWQVTLQTTDSAGVILDDAKIRVATVESVKVTADVDPSITFTIAGINNATALSGQATGCADSTANVPNATSTEVSLGFLRNGQINIAAQKLTVSTNGAQGYSISATSSGQLINPATGYWINGANGNAALSANDVTAPAVFAATGSETFGISACGTRINTTLWGATSCTTAFSSGCKYSNPFNTGTNSYYASIASYTGGPVSNDNTVVKYGASIGATTQPGTYRTIFTYVATATF